MTDCIPAVSHDTHSAASDQGRREGDAAFGHQERVAATFTPGSIEYQVALYHDHLEDGLGDVPTSARPHVEILTRGMDEDYLTYIERVRDSHDPVAIAVKVADLRDNLARCRGEHDGEILPSRARRYIVALRALEEAP